MKEEEAEVEEDRGGLRSLGEGEGEEERKKTKERAHRLRDYRRGRVPPRVPLVM